MKLSVEVTVMMEKFFRSGYSPFVLVALGLVIGFTVAPTHLQQTVAFVGMIGLAFGMTEQVLMQYHIGKVGIHWRLNTIMFFAVVLRSIYMLRTGQYWLAIPDVYSVFIFGVVQFQLAGYLLKKQPVFRRANFSERRKLIERRKNATSSSSPKSAR